MKKTLISLFSSLFFILPALAQAENQDFARSIGKIYIVVAVILVIFIGIVIFMIYLDKKLTKLENQINDHD